MVPLSKSGLRKQRGFESHPLRQLGPVYSVGEWTRARDAREGRSTAPDQPGYDRSIERLRRLDPIRVWFGHDRETWHRPRRSKAP
jgi:hypothetical protein